MDWDDLRTFLVIARAGTLSGAARTLGLTQPTMGRRLAAMEAQIGARLLQRLPGGYGLTALGERVLGHAERAEAEVLGAERTITGCDETLAGTVRLTTVDVLATQIVVPAVAALRRTHPGITVELAPETRSLSLSRREADIALRVTRFEGNEIVARRLGTFGMAAYRARGAGASAALPLITVLDDQADLPEARWLRTAFPDAPVALATNSRDVMLAAARGGIGICALARIVGDDDPDLERVAGLPPAPARDIWIGVHADLRAMPRVRAVIDAVADTMAAFKPRLVPAD
jgi:DNA-binding transcriptional LysR family regulator